jgi:hypothetical protein
VAWAAGFGIPVAALLWFNLRTTGDPFTLGYQVLWGSAHGLGFHPAPWGPAHTPLRGLELTNKHLLELQVVLFESPLPSLLPAIVALALAPRLQASDRYLLAGGGLLLIAYFLYWHEGYYLGPRFLFPLTILAVVWTARFPAILARRTKRPAIGVWAGCILAISLGSGYLDRMPRRWKQYQTLLPAGRWSADSAAGAMGVTNSVILVRESWGAQTLVRLWALGIQRSEAGRLYQATDLCRLDQALDRMEAAGARGEVAATVLRALAKDSNAVRRSTLSPDTTERMLPGARYAPRCRRRIMEDRGGTAGYLPFLLAGARGNVFARDLHGRDTLLLRMYPRRPLFIVTGRPPGPAGPSLILRPLNLDSAESEWRGPAMNARPYLTR